MVKSVRRSTGSASSWPGYETAWYNRKLLYHALLRPRPQTQAAVSVPAPPRNQSRQMSRRSTLARTPSPPKRNPGKAPGCRCRCPATKKVQAPMKTTTSATPKARRRPSPRKSRAMASKQTCRCALRPCQSSSSRCALQHRARSSPPYSRLASKPTLLITPPLASATAGVRGERLLRNALWMPQTRNDRGRTRSSCRSRTASSGRRRSKDPPAAVLNASYKTIGCSGWSRPPLSSSIGSEARS
mmetsp:Transcript_64470/g.179357  ORF Transcript_64470/g.179357 Transcript_64470/m.179357 type:complete len:243 (+) Transcript_64470:601-1329(+)